MANAKEPRINLGVSEQMFSAIEQRRREADYSTNAEFVRDAIRHFIHAIDMAKAKKRQAFVDQQGKIEVYAPLPPIVTLIDRPK
jgi:Arc/MetJ-type ribon-helix-helix transcriptional regulator